MNPYGSIIGVLEVLVAHTADALACCQFNIQGMLYSGFNMMDIRGFEDKKVRQYYEGQQPDDQLFAHGFAALRQPSQSASKIENSGSDDSESPPELQSPEQEHTEEFMDENSAGYSQPR